jgi:uncharacterized protein
MKKYFLFFLIVLSLFSCNSSANNVKIKLNGKIYSFEVAATEKARQTGLMFVKKLDRDGGMLFVYGQKQELYYYMKNTFIPLDIAFIDENLRIIDIQSMEPLDETTIQSKGKAMYALEVNRGFYEKIGVKVGDKLEIISPLSYKVE